MSNIELKVVGDALVGEGTVSLRIDWNALGGMFAEATSDQQADFLDAVQTGFGDFESIAAELLQLARIVEAVPVHSRVALRTWASRLCDELDSPGESTSPADARIARAAALLRQPVEYVEALTRTYEEARGIYSEEDRMVAADTVLWWRGDSQIEPGSFFSGVMLAWGRADRKNSDRLAVAFPVIADAINVHRELGADGLRAWARG